MQVNIKDLMTLCYRLDVRPIQAFQKRRTQGIRYLHLLQFYGAARRVSTSTQKKIRSTQTSASISTSMMQVNKILHIIVNINAVLL